MIIEFEINGARVIVSGENLSVSVTQDGNIRDVAIRMPDADEIVALRRSMSLTQHQFSALLSVSQSMISKWETGEDRPSGESAVKLAKMIADGNAATVTGSGMDALKHWLKSRHGRQRLLADELGISTQAISLWKEIPADRIVAIEAVTGIPRQVLAPSLFTGMVSA